MITATNSPLYWEIDNVNVAGYVRPLRVRALILVVLK
jgi:hypothetical protein